jgi:PPOX class probable F420-dependent enzyme
MARLDFSTDVGKRALDRLERETVVWLTTTSPEGFPMPTPVWFMWTDGAVLIYSIPESAKVRAIRQRRQVSLNFNADVHGHDVTVFRGVAELLDSAPLPSAVPGFLEKYQKEFAESPVTPEGYDQGFTQAIRVTLTGMRGF